MYETPDDDNILGRGDERGGDSRRRDPGPAGRAREGRVAAQALCGQTQVREARPQTNQCIFQKYWTIIVPISRADLDRIAGGLKIGQAARSGSLDRRPLIEVVPAKYRLEVN
jgi:hypothetical protein